jgi:hypothetical protein
MKRNGNPNRQCEAKIVSAMATHEEHILRVLGEATEPLFPSEITERLNRELVGETPCTTTEVALHLNSLNQQVIQASDGRWMLKRWAR